jgi:hypothetical protein
MNHTNTSLNVISPLYPRKRLIPYVYRGIRSGRGRLRVNFRSPFGQTSLTAKALPPFGQGWVGRNRKPMVDNLKDKHEVLIRASPLCDNCGKPIIEFGKYILRDGIQRFVHVSYNSITKKCGDKQIMKQVLDNRRDVSPT